MGQSAILSLGSNIEPRFDYLRQAVQFLGQLPRSRLLRISPVYETEPVGTPSVRDTPFLNCIVLMDTALAADVLLDETLLIERQLQRVRSVYGAPRTIDIDVICVGNEVMQTPHITLPHPRAHVRRFVLQPLHDLDPDFVLPGFSVSVTTLLHTLSDVSHVQRFTQQF